MERAIPFVKYTSCGNNFVIVDEARGKLLSEAEMADFAYHATSTAFGVGSDNLLIIQRCSESALKAIARERHYWDVLPDASQAQFLFRMFEPSGEEALCCGNGLVCIADYLRRYHGVDSAKIMTEIPFPTPKIVTIGGVPGSTDCRVNLGHPRRAPAQIAKPGVATPYDGSIDVIERLTIQLRAHDLKPWTDAGSLTFSGYLVFTGEPHLVVFPDRDFSIPTLADSLFGAPPPGAADSACIIHRADTGSWLVHSIGRYLNARCRDMFPMGLNVNFVRLRGPKVVEYRCYERGIDRETLACGTGAVAVAHVAATLHALPAETIEVLPQRCRWHDPNARIQVQRTRAGWVLNTTPVMLFEGIYGPVPQWARSRQADHGHPDKRCAPLSEIPHAGPWTAKPAAVLP